MEYPNHDLYERLYARYLAPGRTEQLLALCGELGGRHVLDLCGGGGRAARLALQAGARSAVLVDASPLMTRALTGTPGLSLVIAPVESALHAPLSMTPFDVVLCQQAINYWFDPALFAPLRQQMAAGGVFVFNTFWDPPPAYPVPKEYVYEGRRYLELSWRSSDTLIEHVQVCEGLAPHTTRFQWVSPEAFHAALEPYFLVEEYREGKTSVYRCVAR
jgi:SAM-dependent methyltransferase